MPSLTSYLTMGHTRTTCPTGQLAPCPTGEMCGSTTAQSLYNVLVPAVLTGSTCSNWYTSANTLLDVYVERLQVHRTGHRDQGDPARHLARRRACTRSSGIPAPTSVTGCKKNGVPQSSLTGCLANAGYSSLFQFTTDRVIGK